MTITAPSTVHIRARVADLRSALRGIPQGVCGGGPQADAVLVRAGLALLSRIRRAFITKARGGTDEAGERWAPLSPKTIAYGRRGRSRKESRQSARPSQALSDAERDRWWYHYRRGLAMYRGDKKHAAALAWTVVKAKGARTLFDKYAGRSVEILRDTGVLLNSLSPGLGNPDTVLRVERGSIAVGTNVPYAAAHHNGRPGKLPQRRLWPAPARWPASWWRDIQEQIGQGLVDAAAQLSRKL